MTDPLRDSLAQVLAALRSPVPPDLTLQEEEFWYEKISVMAARFLVEHGPERMKMLEERDGS